jgi:hypothetical protein
MEREEGVDLGLHYQESRVLNGKLGYEPYILGPKMGSGG